MRANPAKKQPSFGYEEDGIKRYCKDHKTNDMINVANKKFDNST